MHSKQQKWYKAGGDIVARAGFCLVMCGTLAAVIYATHRNGSEQLAAASTTRPGRTATVLEAVVANPVLSGSQVAIDASPAVTPAVANIPIPLERVAAADQVPRHVPLPARRAVREPVVATAKFVRFESCLPGCDTRDPLIVRAAERTPPPVASPRDTDELVEEVDFRDRGPGLLGRALDAPGAVYRTGRQALTSLVAAAL